MKRHKPSLSDLTPAQAEALLAFAKAHGTGWKDTLLTGWLRAAYPGPLQQIRNTYGPVWLDGVEV